MRRIVWSDHATLKLEILRQHGLDLGRGFVEDTVRNPERVDPGYRGRLVAQRSMDESRTLRVVYDIAPSGETVVVTLYPARKDRYA